MNKLMITVAAVALLAGETAASAQSGYANGGSWRRDAAGAQGAQTQVAQNDPNDRQGRRDRQGQGQQGQSQGQSGGRGQTQAPTQAPTQTHGSPDWAAYYRNNKDLQRVYEGNRAAYQANGESPTAFAERHYREHGQAEGRALPRSAAGDQTTSQSSRWGGQGQVNGGGRSGSDYGRRGDQWRGDGSRGDQWRGDGSRGDQGRDGDRNWQDWNRRYGDQSRSFRRQGGYAWDGRNWRPERFDRHDYNRNWYAQRRFRLSPYYRPDGWYYQRWSFGQILPFVFFSQNYWIDSYWSYGLPVPPYGCEWVRYGDDALLVDVQTGEVLQVVYNLFY